jgi:hypothetical protein
MNLDERENYGPEDQSFQNNYRRDEDQQTQNLPAEHSVINNKQPDYGNDVNIDKLDNEHLGTNESDTDELGIEKLDDELNTEENNELGGENFDHEGLDYTGEDREINPDRPL